MNKVNGDRLGAVLILIVCIAYAYSASTVPLPASVSETAFTPRSVPILLSIAGIALSIWILVSSVRTKPINLVRLHWYKFLACIALMVAYALTIRWLGFVLSTTAFLYVGFIYLGAKSHWRALLVAILTSVLFWLLMNYGLGVYLAPWPAMLLPT